MEVGRQVIRNRKCTLARELVLNIARVKMWKDRICPFVCSLFYNAEDCSLVSMICTDDGVIMSFAEMILGRCKSLLVRH
jgi:hypothetical protein